jgi:hypothetical protein
MCQKHGLQTKDKCIRPHWHTPQAVLENGRVKLLWDFTIKTDYYLRHNRPDIVVREKEERICNVINIACHFHTRVLKKENEKSKIPRFKKRNWNDSQL